MGIIFIDSRDILEWSVGEQLMSKMFLPGCSYDVMCNGGDYIMKEYLM